MRTILLSQQHGWPQGTVVSVVGLCPEGYWTEFPDGEKKIVKGVELDPNPHNEKQARLRFERSFERSEGALRFGGDFEGKEGA